VKLTNFAPPGLCFSREAAAFGNETENVPMPPLVCGICEVFASVGEFSDCRHLNIIGLSGNITSSKTNSMMRSAKESSDQRGTLIGLARVSKRMMYVYRLRSNARSRVV